MRYRMHLFQCAKKQNIVAWNITLNPQGVFWIHKTIGLKSTRETKIEKKKKKTCYLFIYLSINLNDWSVKKNYRLAGLFKGFIKLDKPKKYILKQILINTLP